MRARRIEGSGLGHQKRIARIGDHFWQPVRQPQPLPGLANKHHPGVRGNAPAIEGGSDFLVPDGWNKNGRRLSPDMAGVARKDGADGGVKNQSVHKINALCHIRQPVYAAR